MSNIAYIRVSTVEQHEDRQRAALEPYNIERWYVDKCSGKDTNRPQYRAMMDYIRDGDTLYIMDFSRLSRSVGDLLNILQQLDRKGVTLVSLKESTDTSTPTGKLIITVIAAINQFERDNLLERQREGIACAKAKGVYKGRKRIPFPDNWQSVYQLWYTRQITAAEAMRQLDLRRNTYYNLVKQYQTQAVQTAAQNN